MKEPWPWGTTPSKPFDGAGAFHEVTQLFVGPNGKEHFGFHINAKGTGVGRTTGARYQWNDRLFDITNDVPSGRGTLRSTTESG